MNILSRINTGISVVIFAACCVAFIVFGVSGSGWKALTIPTGSMRPGMPPGSLALVHHVPDSTLKVGDVITYVNPLHPSTTVSHRIIKKVLIDSEVPGFITKGDANKVSDVPFVAGAVEGKVVWHIPYVGSWIEWGKTWTGLAVLVYTPALLVVIEEILRVNTYYKSLVPYRLFGYKFEPKREPNGLTKKFAVGVSTALAVIFVTGIAVPVAEALFATNTVALTHNSISLAQSGGGNQCSGNTTNNNNVHINNSTTQSASSGNADVSGNTTGGNARSGSASNSNSTTITIAITNC